MTLVLAHRGAHAQLPENSLPAFAEALALGAGGVELDVRLTADNQLVVHHDDEVPGHGLIGELPRSQLPRSVPSLAEVLDLCAGAVVNIEVKRAASDVADSWTVATLLELLGERLGRPAQDRRDWPDRLERPDRLDRAAPRDRVVVSSFVPAILDQVVAAGGLEVGWLVAAAPAGVDLVALAVDRGYGGIHPHFELADGGFVEAVHAAGLAVRPWTVNEPSKVADYVALGVEAVITDDVAGARLVRDDVRREQSRA